MDKQFEKDKRLLEVIKSHLPELEALLQKMQYEYEDRIYRLYHQSFKVYALQSRTIEAADLFRRIAKLMYGKTNKWFEAIVAQGTGIEFEMEHNQNWLLYTRPIVEAYLHAKYFVEMMVKYGQEMEDVPMFLPSGWAAILELYDQR